MQYKRALAVVVVMIGSLVLSAGLVRAEGPLGCYGGYGYGYLYRHLDYKIPYFAAYPPVYYSYPVPRTYGYSPFAYPPGTMTPDVVEAPLPEPVTILNPYVEQPEEQAQPEESVAARQSPQPLVILNPHFEASPPIVQVAD